LRGLIVRSTPVKLSPVDSEELDASWVAGAAAAVVVVAGAEEVTGAGV
jgi:hypothetical protein